MNVLRLVYASFTVPDVEKMADYYRDVMGLTETGRENGAVHLSCTLDHHAVVLTKGLKTSLSHVGLQVASDDMEEVAWHLREHGVKAEIFKDTQSGIGHFVRATDPNGLGLEFFGAPQVYTHPPASKGIVPFKLGHIATMTPEVKKTVAFYQDVLGFRFSDSIEDYFYFLRCGSDHHVMNFLEYKDRKMHHYAFELNDIGHLHSAADTLARANIPVLWGPLRHGVGHNIAMYHRDPAGQIVEFFVELDQITNEGLGWFDPRSWHEDYPQRPKRWDTKTGRNHWGSGPVPDGFLD
jgi:catechol-2,3-dioxygenase